MNENKVINRKREEKQKKKFLKVSIYKPLSIKQNAPDFSLSFSRVYKTFSSMITSHAMETTREGEKLNSVLSINEVNGCHFFSIMCRPGLRVLSLTALAQM